MIKAGLLGVIVGFIYMAGLTLISPFCAFCFTPLLGLGVGYLAAWFDSPQQVSQGIGRGLTAGGITVVGAVVGQILGTIISATLVTHLEQLPDLLRSLGLADLIITDAYEYWQTTFVSSVFCSILNAGIIASLGAVGGLLWAQRHQPL